MKLVKLLECFRMAMLCRLMLSRKQKSHKMKYKEFIQVEELSLDILNLEASKSCFQMVTSPHTVLKLNFGHLQIIKECEEDIKEKKLFLILSLFHVLLKPVQLQEQE